MKEKISARVGNKVAETRLRPIGLYNGLLLEDDPLLHSLIKRRIGQKLKSSEEHPLPSQIDDVLPEELVIYLTEEVALQHTDFPIASEKLSRPVFEMILKNIAHLDFRSFTNAHHSDFSLYDPDVITPQVSWAVEQIFQNLPGFFNLFDELIQDDSILEEEQTNIIRNIFILGYLHGVFSDSNQDSDTAKLFLVNSIRKSNGAEKKLKSYPVFLRKLVEIDPSTQTSPRLDHLKSHWKKQLARRWLMMSRVDEASPDALSPATKKQAEILLPIDRRPAENLAVARKMDRFAKAKMAFKGNNLLPSQNTSLQSNEAAQTREELHLNMDAAQLRESATMHMRDTLRLYQGNNREAFHNGGQVTEKWSLYKIVAETILQKLVLGFASLNESKNDDNKFDLAMDEIVKSMIQILTHSGDEVLLIKEMFGSDFFNLAKIEQLCLMSFTALSFINGETSTSKLAIQILDRLLVPRLNQYFDLDNLKKISKDNIPPFSFLAFDKKLFQAKSERAKIALGNLEPTDELTSIDNEAFQQLFNEQKQLLSGVSKIYSFFASLTTENWGDYAKFKTGILGLIFAVTAFISGYLNFNLSQDLLTESLSNLFSKDLHGFLLKIMPILLTVSSGALLMGDLARQDFKKLLASSSELKNELKKFSTGGWRQVVMVLFLSIYASSSTFPLWENQAKELLDSAKDQWKEMFNRDQEVTNEDSATIAKNFWEDRNPEAVNTSDLLKVKKVDWGELVIGEDVFGKSTNSPIGFITTFVVSPFVSDSGQQEFSTEVRFVDSLDIWSGDNIVVNAMSYFVDGDNNIVFELANGEQFIQSAAGTDFVVKNGLANGTNGLASFLDTGRYVDKIIVVNKGNDSQYLFFEDGENFRSYNNHDEYFSSLSGNQLEYFVVYKTNSNINNEIRGWNLNFDKNLVFWQTQAEERKIIREVLEKENPVAAALYSQMRDEQRLFWENYDPQQQQFSDYFMMVEGQIAEYNHFVQTNHLYSLQYHPKTKYVEQYPEVGVLLDVMSLKTGGYYCQTAHLAAQEWFLSLGVPMDGLYGYHVYDDKGTVRSRIGHVQTGVFGAVYDFTPSIPNPDEDLRALNFDKNTNTSKQTETQVADEKKAAIIDLLQKLASADNLALIVMLLSSLSIGYSVKLGIDQIKNKTKNENSDTLKQIKLVLPDNELAMRNLSSALIQLLSLITEFDQLFPNQNSSSGDRSQVLSQIVKEILILATTQSNIKAELALKPEVLSLLQLVGLGDGSHGSNDRNQAEKLWQKLSDNKNQTQQILEEVLAILDSVSVDFEKSTEIKRKSLEQSVRKLQKQLMRMRKKENRIYGIYGQLLETSLLLNDEKISKLRETITADYLIIHHEIEKQSKELQQLTTQAKLIPINVRNLKKVLSFILDDIKEHGATHE